MSLFQISYDFVNLTEEQYQLLTSDEIQQLKELSTIYFPGKTSEEMKENLAKFIKRLSLREGQIVLKKISPVN